MEGPDSNSRPPFRHPASFRGLQGVPTSEDFLTRTQKKNTIAHGVFAGDSETFRQALRLCRMVRCRLTRRVLCRGPKSEMCRQELALSRSGVGCYTRISRPQVFLQTDTDLTSGRKQSIEYCLEQ